ncbi:uncharacterized protein LOC112092050 [Morus notabilis]|uniref:uncharacterized protein LOC112092050 n=1 Tax=Morus notabilis TaxID=981085 RepID=UPI000CED58A9|nr:uncharacterized protein LOC112092050 [Morus notabilis]
MEIFYNGLNAQTRMVVNSSANGALLDKSYNEAYAILERIANNDYQYPISRDTTGRRVVGSYEVDALTAITVQVSSLANMAKSMKMSGEAQQVKTTTVSCVYCRDDHLFEECPSNPASVCYMGNFKRGNNPYSNSYNPGWKQHLNFSWSNQDSSSSSRPNRATPLLGYQQTNPLQKLVNQEQKNALKIMLKEYIAKNEMEIQNQSAMIQNQVASLRNLENQMGQLANALNNRSHGTLPSDTEKPRHEGNEHCKAIALRSGKELEMPKDKSKKHGEPSSIQPEEKEENGVKDSTNQHSVENFAVATKQNSHDQQKVNLSPPFPQRFQKQQQHKQFGKFLNVLKQLHINIPLVEALEQMPTYAKFMKDMLTKKRRFGEFETMALTKECSVILQSKLPPKLSDPGSFTIPCSIGDTYCGRALCDLGASINLMPMSFFKQLGICEARPTTVTLQFADRSFVYPEGKIEDVLVRVDKFIFLVDFIVLDYEPDKEVPIILGRPFLATGRTLIDVQKGELTMRVHDEQVTFNVFKAMQFSDDVEKCAAVSIFYVVVNEEIQKMCCKDAFQVSLFGIFDEDNGEDNAQVTWVGTKQHGDNGKRLFESLELTEGVFKRVKPSIKEAPVLELKPLPSHLRYAYLGEGSTLPVIISSSLDSKQEKLLLEQLS